MDQPTTEKEFRSALDYLYSFIDFSRLKQSEAIRGEFDLSQMKSFLAALGNPETKLRIIHVAGTKGKGSTSSMIAQILKCSGYKVGLFTSPHLQEFTERIQINGIAISQQEFIAIVDKFRPILTQLGRITWFEITTAVAFYYFSMHHVDFAVMEVGLGGRLDATNVAVPIVSVITSISMDHMKTLGDTVDLIAAEKGGIIKDEVPLVLSTQYFSAAEKVILDIAHERKVKLYRSADWVNIQSTSQDYEGQQFVASWKNGRGLLVSEEFFMPLLGNFQLENAGTVLTIILALQQLDIIIGADAIKEGFRTVFWPGRLEILNRQPLVIVDSAHNPYSMARLMESVRDLFPGKKIIGLFGSSMDKDIRGMLEEFLPYCAVLIASQSTHPRSCPPAEIIRIAEGMGYNGVAITPVELALSTAFDACDEDTLLLATGSIFLSAAVRNIWHHEFDLATGFHNEYM